MKGIGRAVLEQIVSVSHPIHEGKDVVLLGQLLPPKATLLQQDVPISQPQWLPKR
jgi:hypothetical protein